MKLFYSLLFMPIFSHGEIYKCTTASGDVTFSDSPCTQKSEIFIPSPVMTSLKDIKPPPLTSPVEKRKHTKQQALACPHFTTTELRSLRVKDQYKIGLTKSEISKRLGEPYESKKSGSLEKWKYKTQNAVRDFTFKDGCLTQWKERWLGDKSRLSKYQE